MAGAAFPFNADAMRNIVDAVADGKKVFERPFGDARGQEAVRILRFGTKGISQQFEDQRDYRGDSATPWSAPKAFGTKAAKDRALNPSNYMEAWLGGQGAQVDIQEKVISVGVDESLFPMVKIHQGRSEIAVIKAKTPSKTRPGDWAMRLFFGWKYGVWLTKAKVRDVGMRIPRRRLSISNDVIREISDELKRQFGEATAKRKVRLMAPSPRRPSR